MSRTATAGPLNLGRQGFGAMRLGENNSGDPNRDPARVIDAVLDARAARVRGQSAAARD